MKTTVLLNGKQPHICLPKLVLFYDVNGTYGAFSNLAPYPIEQDGVWWPTVEHHFQAQKFHEPSLRERIRQLPFAEQAAVMGRSRHFLLRPDWEDVKYEIMRRALYCKFTTHAPIRELLIETGEALIIEDARDDYCWGCGRDGSGRNMLGLLLMELRTVLQQRER
ncbi:N-glycosidase YbiA [Reticulibacter mediterranei]|uniref:N-glycosidase YbiA n=1 Tax=Reticulibacter mediterranei TaxID=2778369 RepID=A0A8J3IRQ9_9CHLR|nr:NADAR family protein [Reticulibacter mediterranei]GHP00830.1 N-glycosidase YbiA [Reticulibacter mediterranei]